MNHGLTTILSLFAFATGACIASFLNVVIWRLPRGESLVRPPSHCPKCGARIRWHQNIPILAWLALRGRCASCKAPISPRYILIETLGGCLFLAAFFRVFGWCPPQAAYLDWAPWLELVVLWTWLSFMIVGSMIDFDHQLLPDFVTVGGMILGVTAHAVLTMTTVLACPPHSAAQVLVCPIVPSLLGLGLGFGLLWLVRHFGSKAFGREAMGMGDVFLMGAVGALFGPIAVLFTLVLSSVFGSIVGLGLVALSKARLGTFVEIPYGPYICLGCLAWIFCGREILAFYLRLTT